MLEANGQIKAVRMRARGIVNVMCLCSSQYLPSCHFFPICDLHERIIPAHFRNEQEVNLDEFEWIFYALRNDNKGKQL